MSDTRAAPEVLVDQDGAVLLMTINRPGQRNAVNRAVAVALADALDELDRRPDLRVGVLTGAGGNFSAGMDLKAFAAGQRPVTPGRGFAGLVQAPPRKPLVAAVEGWALGGGFEMVLACDLVVAADGARFGLPEVSRGLAARGGGAFRLPRRIPHALAMEILLTGEPIDAIAAERFGLINRLTPDGQALDAALELGRLVARNAPLAVTASKAVALESATWTVAEAFDRQDQFFDPVFASADAKEGATAFRERREPTWRSS